MLENTNGKGNVVDARLSSQCCRYMLYPSIKRSNKGSDIPLLQQTDGRVTIWS